MLNSVTKLISIIYNEQFCKRNFDRTAEPAAMANHDQVAAWHSTGDINGPLTPIYFVTANACSSFVPKGGVVIDLGCGTGRFAAYLAKLRPDIKVIGLDLSAEMVKQGNNSLRAENLADRVTLIECDMIKFSQHAPPETSLVTSIFSLHHLPGLNLVSELFNQVNIFTEKTGGSFFLFDLVRPRHIQTTLLYPEVFIANSAGVFKEDTTNSLKAAFTHEEIKESFEDAFRNYKYKKELSRILPLYQSFWIDGRNIKDKINSYKNYPLNQSINTKNKINGLEFILPKTVKVYKK